ncbi:site-specific integrase [Streptomyces werraensis]|nr:site-specific integrase [Streptomyces werraensis]
MTDLATLLEVGGPVAALGGGAAYARARHPGVYWSMVGLPVSTVRLLSSYGSVMEACGLTVAPSRLRVLAVKATTRREVRPVSPRRGIIRPTTTGLRVRLRLAPGQEPAVRRALGHKRIVPWTPERVFAVRAAMPERYQAMVDLGGGCGLRQGEILSVAVDAIDFASDTLHVVQQLKLSRSKAVFAPPKGGKLRDVPLPGPVADALRAHMKRFPPVEITLPWKVADGPPVTKRLIFTGPRGGHVWRTSLNEEAWKPALAAAGIIPVPERGRPYAESRENGMHALRHFYASVLLDAGENVKALAEYLGHSDPGLTLRVYAHLLPTSSERTRRAVHKIYDEG